MFNNVSPYPQPFPLRPPHGFPAGVMPPPGVINEAREAMMVRQMNADRSPAAVQWTTFLDKEGGRGLWKHFTKQYRQHTGFLRGWAGTALVNIALGVNALRTHGAKRHYDRLRPYQVDPSISPIMARPPVSHSYPSGHASSAYAASTVLQILWPERAAEFEWWARQVAMSRIHGGVHFPSDVIAGARLGRRVGLQTASILF